MMKECQLIYINSILAIMIRKLIVEELIKDYKQNIQKWYFIAAADIVFALDYSLC